MYPQYPQGYYNEYQLQQRRINELEKKIAQLQDDLTALKQEPRTNIERLEYKFDQLKIEKLDGTLNIGLSPGKGEVLDEFAVEGQPLQTGAGGGTAAHPGMAESIQRNLADYLSGDAWGDLKQIEKDQQYPLDDPYRRFIMEDIRKQVHPRIQHYLNQTQDQINDNNQKEIENQITKQVKADIYQGMVNFVHNLKQGGETS